MHGSAVNPAVAVLLVRVESAVIPEVWDAGLAEPFLDVA